MSYDANVKGLDFYSELMGEANFYDIVGNDAAAEHKQELAGAAVMGYELDDKLHEVAKEIDENKDSYNEQLDKFPKMNVGYPSSE